MQIMSTSCSHTSMMLPISLLYLLTSLWSTSSDSILAQNGVQLRIETMDSMDCVRNSDVTATCKCKQDGQQNAILSRMKRTLSIICHCSKLNCQKLSQHHTPATQFASTHTTHCKHPHCAYLQCRICMRGLLRIHMHRPGQH